MRRLLVLAPVMLVALSACSVNVSTGGGDSAPPPAETTAAVTPATASAECIATVQSLSDTFAAQTIAMSTQGEAYELTLAGKTFKAVDKWNEANTQMKAAQEFLPESNDCVESDGTCYDADTDLRAAATLFINKVWMNINEALSEYDASPATAHALFQAANQPEYFEQGKAAAALAHECLGTVG